MQHAINAPRWLLGCTWRQASTYLKLMARFSSDAVDQPVRAGHDIELVPAYSDRIGHTGAISVHTNGVIEGATDPRADGACAGV